jgi:hypothetical protein
MLPSESSGPCSKSPFWSYDVLCLMSLRENNGALQIKLATIDIFAIFTNPEIVTILT